MGIGNLYRLPPPLPPLNHLAFLNQLKQHANRFSILQLLKPDNISGHRFEADFEIDLSCWITKQSIRLKS